jgi:PASTA domain
VCLTVTPGWGAIVSFLVTDVPGNSCRFFWGHRRFSTPLPITNRSFSEGTTLTGSFPSDKGAGGTIVLTQGTCTSGPVNWVAYTDARPPWVGNPLPTSPPPPTANRGSCVVPGLKGKTVAQARSLLRARRCALGRVTRTYSARVRRGKIAAQSRRAGARLRRGTRVNVVVSRGRRR